MAARREIEHCLGPHLISNDCHWISGNPSNYMLPKRMRCLILISACVLLGGCIEAYRDTRAVTCLKSLYFPPGSKNHEQSKQWAGAWKIDRIGCYGVTQIKK